MIKVIKTEPDQSVIKRVICSNCGSTLEYTPRDVEEDYSTDYTGYKDYFKLVKCPVCSYKQRV